MYNTITPFFDSIYLSDGQITLGVQRLDCYLFQDVNRLEASASKKHTVLQSWIDTVACDISTSNHARTYATRAQTSHFASVLISRVITRLSSSFLIRPSSHSEPSLYSISKRHRIVFPLIHCYISFRFFVDIYIRITASPRTCSWISCIFFFSLSSVLCYAFTYMFTQSKWFRPFCTFIPYFSIYYTCCQGIQFFQGLQSRLRCI
jgi:hypothetical protein